MGLRLRLSASMGQRPFSTAMEIDRLGAEGECEAAGVWREVLKRLNVLERGSSPE
jgi:hypothetical protein